MATPRKSEPDERLLDAARAVVNGPLRRAISEASGDISEKLGVPALLAAAALADVIETRALRGLAEGLVLEAEESLGDAGLTSVRKQLAELLGTTRQGIERRYAAARQARKSHV